MVVTAVKKGKKSDPSSVTIEVVTSAAGVTICAVYPSSGKRKNSCGAGDEGSMSTDNNDVSVNFTVQVPAGVKFAGHTVNGSVSTERLGSDAEVSTVNGDVRVVAAGVVRASTVNGSVDVSMGKADWTGKVELSTVNGSIRATFPATFSAVVNGSTVNGSIESEFPLTVQGKFGPRSIHGTIGAGGRTLDLETVNGSITIVKGFVTAGKPTDRARTVRSCRDRSPPDCSCSCRLAGGHAAGCPDRRPRQLARWRAPFASQGPAPHIDGRLSDSAWATAAWFSDLREKDPVEGGPPTDSTAVALLL